MYGVLVRKSSGGGDSKAGGKTSDSSDIPADPCAWADPGRSGDSLLTAALIFLVLIAVLQIGALVLLRKATASHSTYDVSDSARKNNDTRKSTTTIYNSQVRLR